MNGGEIVRWRVHRMSKRYGTIYDWHRRRHNGHVNVRAVVREKQRRNMTLRNGIFLFREAMGKIKRCKHFVYRGRTVQNDEI